MCHHIGMPNFTSPDWGVLLKEMRGSGMTQAQIAEAVKLSQASVSDLINGEVKTTEYTRGLRILHAHRQAMKAAQKTRTEPPAHREAA
jgi:predicted transcriptional regulator